MRSIRQKVKSINIDGTLSLQYPLSRLCSFRVGGPADILAWPYNAEDIRSLLTWAQEENVPWTVIGWGSNILVSDQGIRGLVICTEKLSDIRRENMRIIAGAGVSISTVSAYAADQSLAGLDFIYGMPGSSGGAVWMNARCYGSEIADILDWTEYIDVDSTDLCIRRLEQVPGDFSYKRSPFQNSRRIILSSAYVLSQDNREMLWKRMRKHEEDRKSKGHFAAPCAGSVFKNNHNFGAPSGKIIDRLNLRGCRIGGAKVSDLHANIIINDGTASATNIDDLMKLVHSRVLNELGLDLEPEVIKVGEWP